MSDRLETIGEIPIRGKGKEKRNPSRAEEETDNDA